MAKRYLTIALDRRNGRVLWEREAPHGQLEEIHTIGSHAQPSPAADRDVVVALFGSCGLFCYDPAGKQLWHLAMGPFKNNFGAGSSPLLVDDWVILNQDHDTDSFLAKIDKRSGQTVWRADRSEFPRGYSSPVIWNVAGKRQIVIVGSLRICGYDFASGEEIWTVRGISRITNMTPTIGSDGILYVTAWAPGGDDTKRIEAPPFDEVLAQGDADGDGQIAEKELVIKALQPRFGQIDRDKSGQISRTEWDSMRHVFLSAHNRMLAIRPGGKGDCTKTHVLWTVNKYLPYVSSPIFYHDHLFMIKGGGILSCVDPKSGQSLKVGRVFGKSRYYSSPVAGDGKIFVVSQRGQLSVISASGDWQELSHADFGEDTYATPALVDGRIYLRTSGHLYCFGLD